MATTLVNREYVQLAKRLPPPLINFFKKYPPSTSSSTASTSSQAATLKTTSGTQLQDPQTSAALQPTSPSTLIPAQQNPFLPFKHPASGHWHPPAYSLRRQSQLVKLAREYNVTSLLPWTPKLPSEVERKRIENGLRVKGTGVGQKVKGKLWERTLKGRLDKREKAMQGMDEMIRQWKERGHGRGWKKWPR